MAGRNEGRSGKASMARWISVKKSQCLFIIIGMRESGKRTGAVARVNWFMQMATSMKDSGRMIRLMAKELIYMSMGPNTWAM